MLSVAAIVVLSKRLRYRPALLLRRLCRIFPPRLLSSALSRQHIGMAKRRPGSGGRDSALCHKRYGIELDFYSVFWYLSIFVAALCVALWIVVSKIAHRFTMKDALAWWLSLLANLSFGVYLIHILVMRYWLWQQGWILSITNYVVQCLVIATITIILSIVVCLLISLMPKSDWIIGFHNKKAN